MKERRYMVLKDGSIYDKRKGQWFSSCETFKSFDGRLYKDCKYYTVSGDLAGEITHLVDKFISDKENNK